MRRGPRKRGEPELMGLKEVAAECDVRTSNVHMLAGLPEPYDAVAATTLWRADEIREFARERRIRLGREPAPA